MWVVRLRALSSISVVAAVAGACTSAGVGDASPTSAGTAMRAIMASTDLYVGAPQRVAVGLPLDDGRLVSFGTVSFSFSFLGTSSKSASPAPGPPVTARYVPTPGTPAGGDAPRITEPSQALTGVYEATDVRFDRPGSWQVAVTAEIEGSTRRATVAFPVADAPALPAPGQRALPTQNLTIHSKGVPKAAIDSRAVTTGTIPDPELHEWTIARALSEHRPIVVVFATPVYCVSRFCGPVTDAVDALWKRYRDRAVFIHVEIYRDYNAQPQEINRAAADWLLRNNDLTEPWLYLIGSNGRILDRWSSLFDPGEVARELERLPPMR
jgi:hypothetical protein